MENVTRRDAMQRIDHARGGCLAGRVTLEYLEVLLIQIRDWESSISIALNRQRQMENLEKESV